jgi:hypothetical protein
MTTHSYTTGAAFSDLLESEWPCVLSLHVIHCNQFVTQSDTKGME